MEQVLWVYWRHRGWLGECLVVSRLQLTRKLKQELKFKSVQRGSVYVKEDVFSYEWTVCIYLRRGWWYRHVTWWYIYFWLDNVIALMEWYVTRLFGVIIGQLFLFMIEWHDCFTIKCNACFIWATDCLRLFTMLVYDWTMHDYLWLVDAIIYDWTMRWFTCRMMSQSRTIQTRAKTKVRAKTRTKRTRRTRTIKKVGYKFAVTGPIFVRFYDNFCSLLTIIVVLNWTFWLKWS